MKIKYNICLIKQKCKQYLYIYDEENVNNFISRDSFPNPELRPWLGIFLLYYRFHLEIGEVANCWWFWHKRNQRLMFFCFCLWNPPELISCVLCPFAPHVFLLGDSYRRCRWGGFCDRRDKTFPFQLEFTPHLANQQFKNCRQNVYIHISKIYN